MAKIRLAFWSAVILGAAWTLTPQTAHAEGYGHKWLPPLKIDAGAKVWFNVYTPKNIAEKNRAPWYTYFPHDPSLMGPPPGSMFPNWPQPFPPPGPPDPNAPQGYAPQAPPSPPPLFPRPIASTYAPALQPVSHYAYPAPSYWFAR